MAATPNRPERAASAPTAVTKWSTIDDAVNVTTSTCPARSACRNVAQSPSAGTVRYTGMTSTWAPSASSPAGSASRAVAARGIRTRAPPSESRVASASTRFGDVARRNELHPRSEEHTSELQSRLHLVCRLLLEKKKKET